MGAVVIALLPAILALIQDAPQMIAGVQQMLALAKSDTALTAEQRAQIDAALDAAFKAEQA